jgi:hypothetical protein
MEKLNRKGFFSTLFGGIAGVVAGSSVKASEPIVPPPVVETVVYCDKLVFTHSSGASCVMSFVDSDNFAIRVNNSENISINIHSPLKKPEPVTSNLSNLTFSSNGNIGMGTAFPRTKLDIRGW